MHLHLEAFRKSVHLPVPRKSSVGDGVLTSQLRLRQAVFFESFLELSPSRGDVSVHVESRPEATRYIRVHMSSGKYLGVIVATSITNGAVNIAW